MAKPAGGKWSLLKSGVHSFTWKKGSKVIAMWVDRHGAVSILHGIHGGNYTFDIASEPIAPLVFNFRPKAATEAPLPKGRKERKTALFEAFNQVRKGRQQSDYWLYADNGERKQVLRDALAAIQAARHPAVFESNDAAHEELKPLGALFEKNVRSALI